MSHVVPTKSSNVDGIRFNGRAGRSHTVSQHAIVNMTTEEKRRHGIPPAGFETTPPSRRRVSPSDEQQQEQQTE